MQDARDGHLDMIITKSLSRFGRNTLDCLKSLRELKALNVDVFFEKENISTFNEMCIRDSLYAPRLEKKR